jgi:hypothetical protein
MTSTAEVSPEVVGEVAFAVSAGAGFSGCHSSAVWIQGTHAVLGVRLDRDECERRAAAGLEAITSPDVLNLLLGLPVGEPVPREALTWAERSVLRTVPRGAVSVDGGVVIRRVVPPLEAGLALVPASSWRSGLERAGRFAPFCARAMVLRTPPRNLGDLLMEAGFYGIGVIVAARNAEPDVLVQPTPFRRNRSTVAGWRFLEQVYRQVSSSAAPMSGAR